MAEAAPPQNGEVDPNAPVFAPQAVYVKDLSFEAPNGPRMQSGAQNPAINLSMNTSVTDLSPELKEVVLKLQLEAKVGDATLWLAELQQAGAFAYRNVPPEDLQRLIGIFCPQYMLPYARQTISDLLLKGGFPPFLLPPVNFEGLFDRAVAESRQQGQTQDPPATVN